MIGIGIIGCGKIAQIRHIPEYAQNPNAELIGYYDFVYERAKEMAATYGGRAFRTVEELLQCSEIDAVSVCTANNAHASMTVAALEAGKHVLCEKPMATTLAELGYTQSGAYNTAIPTIIAELGGEAANLYVCRLSDAAASTAIGGDGIHPNIETSKTMAAELAAYLEEILKGMILQKKLDILKRALYNKAKETIGGNRYAQLSLS